MGSAIMGVMALTRRFGGECRRGKGAGDRGADQRQHHRRELAKGPHAIPPWRRAHDKAGATPSYEARFRNAAQQNNGGWLGSARSRGKSSSPLGRYAPVAI